MASNVKKIDKLNPYLQAKIVLTASKSESNRALIIQKLAEFQSGQKIQVLTNISQARDTQTLQKLLQSNDKTLDVLDAGTTMRFLIAYFVATLQRKILTGSPRMQERPVKILVEALQNLGADISYLKNVGFPPVELHSFTQKQQHIQVQGNVSSQYISALLMIGPVLKNGLTLQLVGQLNSRPYVQMTLDLMQYFQVKHTWQNDIINIAPQKYQMQPYIIEADWSGASYWYSFVGLSKNADIELIGLQQNSLQGDKCIVNIAQRLGVHTTFTEKGVRLQKNKVQKPIKNLALDFSNCPDLAQTVVAWCVGADVSLKMTGLESLKIKETNRIVALQNEVRKFGFELTEDTSQATIIWTLHKQRTIKYAQPIFVNTYEDHRMAMAFAPLAHLHSLHIENPDVVLKSYPNFWQDLEQNAP